MTVTISTATAADFLSLVDLMAEFYAESGFTLDRDWAANSFSALLANPSWGSVWLARVDGNVAGYVVLTLHFSMEYGGMAGAIDDLFVRPEYRRSGVGMELVKALLAECQRHGALAVGVEVGEDNLAAKSLYHRCGLSLRCDDRQVMTKTIVNSQLSIRN
ncbi:MAG: GNAT family N-acetyltransferase [Cyanosarcina radialis HA8281-LM2]|jgi:ribosomal protein S18 acetylase RimI-like enzyme|nr:GNAT family N-acetyltransferase [Cyanosarcina radialis HA8281-LM2]